MRRRRRAEGLGSDSENDSDGEVIDEAEDVDGSGTSLGGSAGEAWKRAALPTGLGLYTTVSSRVLPGTSAPGCTGVRLHAVGRRTHVLGARQVQDPVSPRPSVRSVRCLELRVSPPGATRILPSGLSPSVPEFHRLNRWSPGCLTLPWHERVADYYRRFGLSPTPEHVAAGKDTTQSSHDDTRSFSMAVRALTGRHSECVEPVTTSRTVTHGVRNRPAQMIRALPERGLQCL